MPRPIQRIFVLFAAVTLANLQGAVLFAASSVSDATQGQGAALSSDGNAANTGGSDGGNPVNGGPVGAIGGKLASEGSTIEAPLAIAGQNGLPGNDLTSQGTQTGALSGDSSLLTGTSTDSTGTGTGTPSAGNGNAGNADVALDDFVLPQAAGNAADQASTAAFSATNGTENAGTNASSRESSQEGNASTANASSQANTIGAQVGSLSRTATEMAMLMMPGSATGTQNAAEGGFNSNQMVANVFRSVMDTGMGAIIQQAPEEMRGRLNEMQNNFSAMMNKMEQTVNPSGMTQGPNAGPLPGTDTMPRDGSAGPPMGMSGMAGGAPMDRGAFENPAALLAMGSMAMQFAFSGAKAEDFDHAMPQMVQTLNLFFGGPNTNPGQGQEGMRGPGTEGPRGPEGLPELPLLNLTLGNMPAGPGGPMMGPEGSPAPFMFNMPVPAGAAGPGAAGFNGDLSNMMGRGASVHPEGFFQSVDVPINGGFNPVQGPGVVIDPAAIAAERRDFIVTAPGSLPPPGVIIQQNPYFSNIYDFVQANFTTGQRDAILAGNIFDLVRTGNVAADVAGNETVNVTLQKTPGQNVVEGTATVINGTQTLAVNVFLPNLTPQVTQTLLQGQNQLTTVLQNIANSYATDLPGTTPAEIPNFQFRAAMNSAGGDANFGPAVTPGNSNPVVIFPEMRGTQTIQNITFVQDKTPTVAGNTVDAGYTAIVGANNADVSGGPVVATNEATNVDLQTPTPAPQPLVQTERDTCGTNCVA